MATDDDNFDIDIYGDGTYNANDPAGQDDSELILDAPENLPASTDGANDKPRQSTTSDRAANERAAQPLQPVQSVQSVNHGPGSEQQASTNTPPTHPQGTKRKEIDEKPSDPDATAALLISEISWWLTEEDVRGWINASGAEPDVKELTFSEHKVNGKSKGQVYALFSTPQAATIAKKAIVQTTDGSRGHSAAYANPVNNPFKTLPKDTPMRQNNATPRGNYHGGNNYGHNNNGNFRGGRANYNNNRGNYNNFNNRGGHNNFNPMPFQGGNNNPMMGNFGPMGGMNYGFNRGGPMMGNMRGAPRGRGHMGGNMMPMGMNPAMGGMGGMNPMMNPMMPGMAPNMGGNMNMQGQPPFQGGHAPFNQTHGHNQGGFYNNNQTGGHGSNPHGAKRSRQD
ncbi:unnamed protein product [Penicillium olsonii]|nr:unnamed protein product [Penicillium olsonii]